MSSQAGARAANGESERYTQQTFNRAYRPVLRGLLFRTIQQRKNRVWTLCFGSTHSPAFEAGAIDYVMKPLELARLLTTIQRLKARVQQPPTDLSQMPGLADAASPAAARFLQWIRVSHGSGVRLLTVEEICYFKADSKYTLVVSADSESLIKKTIKELAAELDPNMFWQIHRSVTVNVRAIDSVMRSGSSDLAVRLERRNETLEVSEPHHHPFRQM